MKEKRQQIRFRIKKLKNQIFNTNWENVKNKNVVVQNYFRSLQAYLHKHRKRITLNKARGLTSKAYFFIKKNITSTAFN